MAITIPSTELVGLLTDVISFAVDDEDFPELHCLRIEWDGELLHTQAHDGQHIGWSRWSPDDDPAPGGKEPAQESMFAPWGGDDDPWSVVISLADAKLLAKTYKVPDKLMWVPLRVEEYDGTLRVHRDRAPRLVAIRTVVDGLDVGFANIEAVLAALPGQTGVGELAFNATQLAHFATVRPRGPLQLAFTGDRSAVIARIGSRFTGAISPVRVERDERVSDLLRNGSGLFLSGHAAA